MLVIEIFPTPLNKISGVGKISPQQWHTDRHKSQTCRPKETPNRIVGYRGSRGLLRITKAASIQSFYVVRSRAKRARVCQNAKSQLGAFTKGKKFSRSFSLHLVSGETFSLSSARRVWMRPVIFLRKYLLQPSYLISIQLWTRFNIMKYNDMHIQ